MKNICQFRLNKANANLSIVFDDQHTAQLSFEYLRVFAPTDDKGKPLATQVPQVYHKKQVQLIDIESVGKHGYRFIFDDNHQDIYPTAYLMTLINEQDARWQAYLKSTDTAINSREATIAFTEVK